LGAAPGAFGCMACSARPVERDVDRVPSASIWTSASLALCEVVGERGREAGALTRLGYASSPPGQAARAQIVLLEPLERSLDALSFRSVTSVEGV
jgi:hypothetical protein